MSNLLEQLKKVTVVVADTGDIDGFAQALISLETMLAARLSAEASSLGA